LSGALMVLGLLMAAPAGAQPSATNTAVTRLPATGPTLSEPLPAASAYTDGNPADGARAAANVARPPPPVAEPAREASDFERLATEANGGRPVWRLGTQLRRVVGGPSPLEAPARVPPHYVVQVGDEVTVTVWGSVDAHWLLRVDRAGRLTLPRVGPVAVAGATAGELEGLLRARLELVFKAFDVAAAVTDVSPVRVHILGFVDRPGEYVLPGLSTVSSAVAHAQGPSPGGSYRRIRLERNGATVLVFDLYTLLGTGSRKDDRLLQPDDLLFVEPAGPQAAVLGSVNRAAVFEFQPGETVAQALALAGNFSPVAERGSITVERLRDRNGIGAVALQWPRDGDTPLSDGDILRVRSVVAAGPPSQMRNKRVLVEGEVFRPGEYLLPATATLADAVAAAGGATPSAYLFGASLRRESVRLNQTANYERVLRDLERDYARILAARGPKEEGAPDAEAANRELLSRMRSRRPEGRIVLELTPESAQLPPLALEDGDRLLLPSVHQSVAVFGSVVNAGSYVHDGSQDIGQYLSRAGGPSPSADYDAAFVVRANGSVISAAQGSRWSRRSEFEALPALPGDIVFVPEEAVRATLVQGAKDWTQILYQLGVGLAALFWSR
jgi:protein involved in polysaccharide export with SLBB domain